jgi:hypothetical protein
VANKSTFDLPKKGKIMDCRNFFAVFCAFGFVACGGDNSEVMPEKQAPAADAAVEASVEAGTEASVEAAAEAATEAGTEASVEAAVEDAAKEADPEPTDDECKGVPELEAAVLFKAPQPRGDGYLAAAAWIHYPSMAAKPDVPWANPFPGCVAKNDVEQSLLCNFGQAFQGAEITFIFGMNEFGGPTEGLGAFFSDVKPDQTIAYYGEYYACKGSVVVGTFKGGEFEGALAPTEVPANANLKFTIP